MERRPCEIQIDDESAASLAIGKGSPCKHDGKTRKYSRPELPEVSLYSMVTIFMSILYKRLIWTQRIPMTLMIQQLTPSLEAQRRPYLNQQTMYLIKSSTSNFEVL
ncbi:uncharacterized protein [Triticum aestivum]|uniref:uncharacterized protein isoform X1 n=1 Tax=Triticum aestivum TaxID=4565 RepID=UPI001D019CF7|nr:uncharacterized protein LOC123112632 isoform X1 [Triticum aestivum]XP_044389614.1 uncharacterized protein LOC123112632 isoform X1 [Triticum aestivum]